MHAVEDVACAPGEVTSALRPLKGQDAPDRTVLGRLDTILHAFGGSDRVLALSEISQRVGLPKSTVHRLADQLCTVGWLERKSGGYRIGLKLLDLGGIALQRNGLREIAFRYLHSLAVKTGLAVQLGILDQSAVVYLERIVLGRVNLPTRVGGREPAYCTGLGKALLAFEDEQTQDVALLNTPRRTEFTICEPQALKAELNSIRKANIAYDREEAYRGLGCVAAPIRSTGRAIGAISVTGPIGQVQTPWVVQHVRETALAIWERGPLAPAQSAPHAP